jgi:hypothetical protein
MTSALHKRLERLEALVAARTSGPLRFVELWYGETLEETVAKKVAAGELDRNAPAKCPCGSTGNQQVCVTCLTPSSTVATSLHSKSGGLPSLRLTKVGLPLHRS